LSVSTSALEMIRVVKIQARAGYFGPSLEISENVLEAMSRVPRHEFVSQNKKYAYRDQPVPIECKQTMSQPYIVAYMTHTLDIHPEHKVLEIGMGSGYGASVISEICSSVCSIERIPTLYKRATETCKRLGYNIKSKNDDGHKGWVEEAPFDRIMVTAVSKEIPQQLVDQLKIGGKMLIPHNPNITNPSANNVCDMFLVTKDETGWKKKNLRQGCKFVPFLKDFTID